MKAFLGPVKTSAVVTCRDYGRYLIRCLDSVLSQTLPFFEVILIDDDSADETPRIWETLYSARVRYERVRFHSQLPSRNHGFGLSSGDYIVFIDADDWIDASFHEKLIAPLLENPAAGFSYCGVRLVLQGAVDSWFKTKEVPLVAFDARRLWHSNYIPSSALVRRKAWLGKERSYGHVLDNGRTYGEDWDLWLETAGRGWEGILVPERLLYYRIHNESTSRKALEDPRLLDKCRWSVRGRHLSYELTILYLYTGTKPVRRCIDFLRGLEKPQRTQIIFFNGSPGSVPADMPREFVTHYENRPKEELAQRWKTACLKRARHYARGKKVLVLTDENFFREDLYVRLAKGMAARRADFYSAAAYRGKPWDCVMAWRCVKGDPANGLRPAAVRRGVKRVFAALFDGTLIDGKSFSSMPLYPNETGKEIFPFCEARAGAWAAKAGLKWFLDGSIRSLRERPAAAGEPCPGVSIVIPAHNSKRSVVKLLRSIKRLDYPKERLEVIVVDNNSTDGTDAAVLSEGGAVLIREKRQSSYAARNTGVRRSRHRLVAFVDADARVTRTWLKDLVEAMLSRPGIGAVGGANRSLTPKSLFARFERGTNGYQNFQGSPFFPRYVITMNALYRKEVFEEAGFFDEVSVSGSDTDMSLRMHHESRWETVVLGKKGRVGHADVTGLKAHVKRAFRIGSGMYHFYRKRPSFLPPSFFWLPKRSFELLPRCIKDILEWEKTGAKDKKRGVRLASWHHPFRRMIHKAGYIAALKKDSEARGPFSGPGLVFFSSTILHSASKDYPWLRQRAEAGTPVLHAGPPAPLKRSLYQLFLSLCGLTAVWEWEPGVKSLELWDFFPGCGPGTLRRRLNGRLNAFRVRKALGAGAKDFFYLTGDLPARALEIRRNSFGKTRPQILPACFALDDSLLRPPFAACILEEVNESLDIGVYEKIALFSPWPVLIAGPVVPSMMPRLHGIASKTRNLFFYPARLSGAAVDKLLDKTGIAVYAFKPGVRPGLDAAGILKGTRRAPYTAACGAAASLLPASMNFETGEELLRAVRAYLYFPAWPAPRWKKGVTPILKCVKTDVTPLNL